MLWANIAYSHSLDWVHMPWICYRKSWINCAITCLSKVHAKCDIYDVCQVKIKHPKNVILEYRDVKGVSSLIECGWIGLGWHDIGFLCMSGWPGHEHIY